MDWKITIDSPLQAIFQIHNYHANHISESYWGLCWIDQTWHSSLGNVYLICPDCLLPSSQQNGDTWDFVMLIGWHVSKALGLSLPGPYLDIILYWEIWFCALKKSTTEGIHQGLKSNFVRGNLMPTPLYNDWGKLIITNNIPVSAIQELFNRIFMIHVSRYTSSSPFCNISEINSISSSCRLSSRLPG